MSAKKHLLRGLLVSVLLLGLLNCGSSTDPNGNGDDEVKFSFLPAGATLNLAVGASQLFSVSVDPVGSMEIDWRLNGTIVGQSPNYSFTGGSVGAQKVEVLVESRNQSDSRIWNINVTQNGSDGPPAVQVSPPEHGPRPADVVLSWLKVVGSVHPIVEYRIGASYAGPVTEVNWDQADLDWVVPYSEDVGHTLTLTEAEDGMREGESIWFAVRAVDNTGQMSPIPEPLPFTISYAWVLDGRVIDDQGNPLIGVSLVGVDVDINENTDQSGYFNFGEFSSVDTVAIRTLSNDDVVAIGSYDRFIGGWYDFETKPRSVGDLDDLEIVLIPRYQLGTSCSLISDEYLWYLRTLSGTLTTKLKNDDDRLYKWDHYPVTVFIPEFENNIGIDIAGQCRAAIGIWNQYQSVEFRSDFFEIIEDPLAADLEFILDESITGNGFAEIYLPPGGYSIGDTIPEKMLLHIDGPGMTTPDRATGVALHELGHALGFSIHSGCDSSFHLMVVAGGASALLRGEERAVHPLEFLLVNTVRSLPQGIDMNDYLEIP